jgi:hypothetical protein
MRELSYSAALSAGVEPIQYRASLDELAVGNHPGRLDALVWSKGKPALMALLTLDAGFKVQVIGFQTHSRKDLPPYLGLRELEPGQRILLNIDVGARGGVRPTVLAG